MTRGEWIADHDRTGIVVFPRPDAETVSIEAGQPLRARQLWTSRIPGFAGHAGRIHHPSGSLFMSDGWGVAIASLRFRRYDLGTGAELARIRTGTAVRCLAMLPGETELIAATDTKLFRLAADDLAERQRWDRRIPRYSNSIAARGDLIVVANWMGPRVSIVDLATGTVRRRDAPEMIKVVDGATDPLLVGGSKHGGLASIDPRSGSVTPVLDTPPAIDAAIDRTGAGIWLTVGIRGFHTPTSSGPGGPTRELRYERFDGAGQARRFLLPEPVRDLTIGRAAMWLAGKLALLELPLPVGSAPGRAWHAPRDHQIETFDPDARIVIVLKRQPGSSAQMMTAWALD